MAIRRGEIAVSQLRMQWGMTLEFPLYLWTCRMNALLSELGRRRR